MTFREGFKHPCLICCARKADPLRSAYLATVPRNLNDLPTDGRRRFPPWMKAALFVFCLMAPASLHAATISGTVKDPSGAVIPEARIEITGGDLAQTMVVISDGVGKFASAELKPGKYALRVSKDGFESLEQTVDLR